MTPPRPYLTQRRQSRKGTKPFVPFVPLCEKKTRTAAFTVIELILVIGVLAVMLAIIMPGTKALRDASNRRRAAAEATALAQAAVRYKTEYGFWPGELQPNNDAQGTCRLVVDNGKMTPLIAYGNQNFLANLTAHDGGGDDITADILKLSDDDSNGHRIYQAFSTVGHATSPPHPMNPLNPRGIRFLDLQNEGNHLRVDYRDPWGQSYTLFTGLNPRGRFTYRVEGGGMTFYQTVSNQTAFAFSLGSPDHRNTNLIYSAGVDPLYTGGAP
jgi:type II secretory pathway pseudopilin PulG